MKKIICFLLILAVCLSLSGCDLEFHSVDTLMRAPKLSGDERLLQDAFESYSTKFSDVEMKTAVNGKYKSSYIIYDIENDGVTEALVLYSVPFVNNYVNVSIFRYVDDEWKNVTDISGKSEEIYEIDFADINGDRCEELFVSWSGVNVSGEDAEDNLNVNANQNINIYSYSDNSVQNVFTSTFTEYKKIDVGQDGVYELALFKINFADYENTTKARIIKFNDDFSILKDEAFPLTSMLEIVNISSDNISVNNKNTLRIFVDGSISELALNTDVIEIDENTFEASRPLNDSGANAIRNSKIYCMDIDSDGYIEIPGLEKLPYGKRTNDGTDDNINLIVWSEYINGKITPEFKCLFNVKTGYVFIFPDEEIGKTTVIYDEENNNLTFYSIDAEGNYISTLFSIKVFTVPQWEEDNYNYKEISSNESYIYAFKIFKEENSDYYEKFITDNLICY